MSAGLTRRELLVGGAAAGISSAAGASIATAASAAGDGGPLRKTLRIERLVVWVYERVLEEGVLAGAIRSQAQVLLGQERAHVAVVERELAALGGSATVRWTLPSAKAELARHAIGASLTDLRTQHDCLRLLVDIESVAEGAWFAAIGALSDPRLAGMGAQIMACEAQHWTVLSGLSHREVTLTVPYPFVRGSSGY